MSEIVQALIRIGAIQFGQFETQPGIFAPVSIHLGLLPSYPSILRALAAELAPLARIEGLTHLLPTPSAVPIGVGVSLAADIPLVYLAPDGGIEGAYDFSVPTALLTDVLSDGTAERELIKRARPLGLDVKAVVAVLGISPAAKAEALDGLSPVAWRYLEDLLPEISTLTPSMRSNVQEWLMRNFDHRIAH